MPRRKDPRAEAARKARYKQKGSEIEEKHAESMGRQLEAFKGNLEQFAGRYKGRINSDPEFRAQFHRMCRAAKVDPLASKKGFWASALGFGDFYYELGIQCVDACLATRGQNGGLIEMDELRGRLRQMRGRGAAPVTVDDVERAVATLGPLGSGFTVHELGQRRVVQSVPVELNADQIAVLRLAGAGGGHATRSGLVQALGWPDDRAQHALAQLEREGMVWLDAQAEGETAFWFASLR